MILKAPWMERVALTAFIFKSLRLSSSCIQVLKTSVVGNIKHAQMGKRKEKTYITNNIQSHLLFDQDQTAASLL